MLIANISASCNKLLLNAFCALLIMLMRFLSFSCQHCLLNQLAKFTTPYIFTTPVVPL